MTAFDKNGIRIIFNFERNPLDQSQVTISLTATNQTPDVIEEFVFQAAVPKV